MDITQRAARKAAFTLIEVMVVLSILAIIAVLGYNFFGSTVKEAKYKQAVTQIYKDFGVIDAALLNYEMDTGVEQTADASSEFLVASGHLKSEPIPPSLGYVSGPRQYYLFFEQWIGIHGHGAARCYDYWMLWEVSDELCRQYNAVHTGMGETIWITSANGNSFPTDHDGSFCYSLLGAANRNRIVYAHERR